MLHFFLSVAWFNDNQKYVESESLFHSPVASRDTESFGWLSLNKAQSTGTVFENQEARNRRNSTQSCWMIKLLNITFWQMNYSLAY